MQDELEAEHPDLEIHLVSINEAGREAGNELMPPLGDLPYLQDDETAGVWSAWEAEWRDVVVLDGDNEVVTVYNLTEHNLGDAANYAELKALLVEAAGAP
jgi:hypothetical protein